MRRSFFLFVFVLVFSVAVNSALPSTEDFRSQLDEITDVHLRKTLENSIAAGLILNSADFDAAVARAEDRANHNAPIYFSARAKDISEIRREIEKIAKPIDSLDKDAVIVEKNEGYKEDRPVKKLFLDIKGKIPASFDAAYELCKKFNPKSGTNDHSRLNGDIDKFLAQIKNDPVIVHALKSTGTTIEDLKKNWFGSGLGFEHVVAGEVKGSKVSGFHWWYVFYKDERKGDAEVITAMSDVGNDEIFTGSFYWDPDGDGSAPRAKKSKGGFSNGHSVQALLAVGHIAVETARKFGSLPGAMTFYADINGETFTWQLYTMGNSIRSLYPMGKGKLDSRFQSLDCEEEFYDLEEGLISETIH